MATYQREHTPSALIHLTFPQGQKTLLSHHLEAELEAYWGSVIVGLKLGFEPPTLTPAQNIFG